MKTLGAAVVVELSMAVFLVACAESGTKESVGASQEVPRTAESLALGVYKALNEHDVNAWSSLALWSLHIDSALACINRTEIGERKERAMQFVMDQLTSTKRSKQQNQEHGLEEVRLGFAENFTPDGELLYSWNPDASRDWGMIDGKEAIVSPPENYVQIEVGDLEFVEWIERSTTPGRTTGVLKMRAGENCHCVEIRAVALCDRWFWAQNDRLRNCSSLPGEYSPVQILTEEALENQAARQAKAGAAADSLAALLRADSVRDAKSHSEVQRISLSNDFILGRWESTPHQSNPAALVFHDGWISNLPGERDRGWLRWEQDGRSPQRMAYRIYQNRLEVESHGNGISQWRTPFEITLLDRGAWLMDGKLRMKKVQ